MHRVTSFNAEDAGVDGKDASVNAEDVGVNAEDLDVNAEGEAEHECFGDIWTAAECADLS